MLAGTRVLYKGKDYYIVFVGLYVEGEPNVWLSEYENTSVYDVDNISILKIFPDEVEYLTPEKHPEYFL